MNKKLLNEFELNGDFDVDYNLISMMNYIDQEFSQNDSSFNWDHRKTTPVFKAWTRYKGTKAVPNLPMIRAEHIFPDIDDPRIIQVAIN